MGEYHSGNAEQGGGSTVLCVHCLLIRNPRFSTLYEWRSRLLGQLTCMRSRNLAAEKQGGGRGPGPPPRGREHSAEKEAARNCSDLNSEQSPQAGTVFFYPFSLLPSLLNFPPGRKELGS